MNSVDDVHFRWCTLQLVKHLIVQVRNRGKDDEKGAVWRPSNDEKEIKMGCPAKYKVHCPLYIQLVTERVDIYAAKD